MSSNASLLQPFRTAALLLVLLCCVLLPGRSAEASGGILVTVTEVDVDGAQSWWWKSPETPAWSRFDGVLLETLSSLELAVIDPATMATPPTVSRVVYGTAPLSTTNALNLGTLFGASRVVAGEVSYEALPPSPVLGEVGVVVVVDLHVFSTTTSIELLPVQLTEIAWGADLESARTRALAQVAGRMRLLFEHTSSLSEAQVGIQTDEPVLVITGLDRAAPLVAIKKQLKSGTAVQDAVELWAAEGVIAVEINPGQLDSQEQVVREVDLLLRQTFDGFALEEVRRGPYRIEINVVRTRTSETTSPAAPEARQ